MTIPILVPKGILGMCDHATKTITLVYEEALRVTDSELRRLTDLGEHCIKISQTLGGNSIREEMRELGLENIGSKEYPFYSTDAHWAFGILGGLEIYGSQLCDGPRYAMVVDCDEEVFRYNCSDITDGEPENPRIISYVKGSWEEKIPDLYKTTRRILNKKVLTLDEINKK